MRTSAVTLSKRPPSFSEMTSELTRYPQKTFLLLDNITNHILLWGVIFPNINFQILLCHSSMLLFSFLRNSYMHVRILLFPFEFCYLLYWFYYAIMHSFIHFRILLSVICYSLFQFYYANINSVIQFPILLFAFELCSCKSGTFIVYSADSALGTSKEFSRDIANRGSLGRRRFTESITSMHKCNSTAT